MKAYSERQEAQIAERLAKLEEKSPAPPGSRAERRRNRLACAMQRWRRTRYWADRQVARAGFA